MKSVVDEIRSAVYGRHPLVYLHTAEEDRAVAALAELASERGGEAKVSTWTSDSRSASGRGSTWRPMNAT
jgi:hypothetical protein